MATKINLSKITKVELRDCWEYEASDFTPWLASEENIALLAEALGMNELEVKAQEEHVGPFRADILCVDPGTDKLVLIENQLEKTDHNHLGQILTYAAGLDAVTIIWIAERFTEEHRAAIDWLNRITDTEFNFFGVEIELIKIGDSPAAPIFKVIAKPNGWSKEVRSSQASNEGHSEGKIFNYEYWCSFIEYMNNNPSKLFRTRSPSYSHWMSIAVGKSSTHVDLLLNKREQTATVQLYMSDDADKKIFDTLFKFKDDAEDKIGEKLMWRRLDGKKASSVDLIKKCNLNDPAMRDEIFGWYKEYTEKFITYFKPILKKI
jgi:hypothetical protein